MTLVSYACASVGRAVTSYRERVSARLNSTTKEAAGAATEIKVSVSVKPPNPQRGQVIHHPEVYHWSTGVGIIVGGIGVYNAEKVLIGVAVCLAALPPVVRRLTQTLITNIPYDDSSPLYTTIWRSMWTIVLNLRWLHCMSAPHEEYSQYMRTLIVEPHVNINRASSGMRSAWGKTPLSKGGAASFNPHRAKACSRSAADNTINAFIQDQGCEVWSHSMSTKDAYRSFGGTRTYYCWKDLSMSPSATPFPKRSITKMIDVDWHVPLDEWYDLFNNNMPVVFYTIIPHCAAVFDGDTTYWFEEDAQNRSEGHTLHYQVRGSTKYTHKLWDWRCDTVTFTSDAGRTITCNVEIKTLGGERALVCLVPKYRTDIGLAMLPEFLPEGQQILKRLVLDGNAEVNLLTVNGEDGPVTSFHMTGTTTAFSFPSERVAEALSAAKQCGAKLTMATVQRALDMDKSSWQATAALRLLAGTPITPLPAVGETIRTRRNYICEFKDIEPEGRIQGVEFMPPIIDGAFSPIKCKSNDLTCIIYRMDRMEADITKNVPDRYYDYSREFCNFLSEGSQGSLVPKEIHEVIEGSRAGQQREYEEASRDMGVEDLIYKSFQKNEAYPDVKPPRNIFNVDKRHVVNWSRYCQAFSAHLKRFGWYAFALDPQGVADRVHEIAQRALKLDESDFSKFDGTISEFLRYFLLRAFISVFRPNYEEEIRELHGQTLYQTGRTAAGVPYGSGTKTNSGCAATSLGNTLIDAFFQYICRREAGLTAQASFDGLGIYGGDDGLSEAMPQDVVLNTARVLQLKIKVAPRVEGDFVGFLGRIYPNPWLNNHSFFDPVRCLSKIHFAAMNDTTFPADVIAWRKGASLYVTDSCTPILNKVATILMERLKRKVCTLDATGYVPWMEEFKGIEYSNAHIMEKFGETPIFPPLDEHEQHYVLRCMSESLDCPEDVIIEWLEENLKPHSLLLDHPPLHVLTPSPAVATTVDGQLLGPEMEPAPKRSPPQTPLCRWNIGKRKCRYGDKCKYSHTDYYCRDFTKGECKREDCKFPHIPLPREKPELGPRERAPASAKAGSRKK